MTLLLSRSATRDPFAAVDILARTRGKEARASRRRRADRRRSAAPRVSFFATARSSAASASASSDGAYLVTGAAGFIGSHLCETLLRRGAAVVAVDLVDDPLGPYPTSWKRANAAMLHERASAHARDGASLSFHAGVDASDEDAVRRVYADAESRGVRVARVCHLGARSGVKGSMDDPAGTIAANVSSAAAVLNACSTRSPQTVRSFVLASSGSVYGDNNTSVDAATGAPIASRETDATDDPTSPYAASKRAAELVCRALIASKRELGDVHVTACRIFTVYGPRGRPDMAAFRFLTALLFGDGTLTRFGDGTSTWRDYAHVDDVVDALIRAMHRGDEGVGEGNEDAGRGPGGSFEIVNVASGTPTRLGAFIDACVDACGGGGGASSPSSFVVEERPGRAGDVGGTYADVEKASRTLNGWAPRVSLRDGLRATAEWYRTEEAAAWRAVEEEDDAQRKK